MKTSQTKVKQILRLLAVAVALLGAMNVQAATFTAAATGDWNVGATWGNPGNNVAGSGYPGSADIAIINSAGQIVTVNATTEACTTLTITSGTVQNNGTLTISGNTTGAGSLIQGASSTLNLGGIFTVTTVTATASGNTITYTGAAITIKNVNYANLTLACTGTSLLGSPKTVGGNLVFSGSGTYTGTTTGTLAVGGNLTVGGTVIVNKNGGNDNLWAVTGNLTVSGGTFNIANTAGGLSVGGTTTLSSGALTFGSATVGPLTGDFSMSGGTLNTATSPIEFKGNFSLTGGTLTTGSGLLLFSGTGKSISANAPISMSKANITGTISIPSGTTVSFPGSSGTGLTITSPGVLDNLGTVTASYASAAALAGTGQFINDTNATLNLATGVAPSISTLTITAANNTVNYTTSGKTTLALTYVNLGLTGGSGMSAAGSTVTGNLTVSGSTTVATGAWPSGPVSGAVIYSSSGSSTFPSSLSIGALNQTAGTLVVPSSGTLTVTSTGAGTFTRSAGTFTASATSTVSFTGAAPEIAGASATTFVNLTLNNSTGTTLTTAPTINGMLTLTAGAVSGNLTMGAGATIVRTAGTLGSAPTFGATVDVNYNGSSQVTTGPEIPTATTVLRNLIINNAGGVLLGANTTSENSSGTLTLTAGLLDLNGNTLTLATGSTISRNLGTLSAAPTFAGTVNVSYTGSTAATTGVEIPTSTSALSALAINNTSAGGITLGANLTANGACTVAASAKLNVPTTMEIKSTLVINATGLIAVSDGGILKNSGSSTITSTAATLTFASGAKFQHAVTTTTGTVPTAAWNANSTLEIMNTAAIGGTPPSGLAQSFGNVTWDNTQSSGCNLVGVNLNSIAGTFTVKNTGTFDLRLGSTQSPAESWGNLVLQGGTLTTSSSTGVPILNVAGGVTFSGGALTIVGAAPLNVGGDWSNSGGTFTPAGGTVTFNKSSGTQNISGATTFNKVAVSTSALALAANQTAATLALNSVNKASGTWGATGSGATHINDTFFSGTSGTLTVTVGVATTTSLARHTGTVTPSLYGDSLLFDVSVSGTTPTGSITLKEGGSGGTTIGSGILSGGTCIITNTLSVGAHANIVAVYGGDDNFSSSTSSALSQTVNPAPLGITANDTNKVYDGVAFSGNNGVTYYGFMNGETNTDLTGALSYTGTSQGATTIGSYTITPAGYTSANYAITYTNGTLAITARPITVTAQTNTKDYDGDTSATNVPVLTTGTLADGEGFAMLSEVYSDATAGTGKTLIPSATITNSASTDVTTNYAITLVNDMSGVINSVCTSPTIIGGIDPGSLTVTVGSPVVLTLTNFAGTTLAFQWQSNNVDIASATNSSYTNLSMTMADTGNYQVVITNDCGAITSSVAVLTVDKATPVLTAPTATAITYGQTLADSVLIGGAATNASNGTIVAGSFAFTAPAIAPSVGTAPQDVTFTPTDTANYNNATITVSVTVNPACTSPAIVGGIDPDSLAVTVGSPAVFGLTNVTGTTPFAYQWLSNTVAISGATNSSYTNLSVTVADAGNYQVVVTNDCGSITSSIAVLTVNPQTPLIATAPTATFAITYGQALSAAGLTGGSATNAAGAVVSGSFDYTTPGATPDSGTASQNVTFTPTDTANYTTATTTVSVTVNKATPTATLVVNNSPVTYNGLAQSAAVSITASNTPGSVANILTGGAVSQINANSYQVTADYVPTDTNYNTLNVTATSNFIIQPAPVSVTADPKTKTYGDVNPALTATEAGTVNGDALNYTLATDATQFSSVGVSNITVSLGSNPNYSVLATNSTLTIGAKAVSVTADAKSKTYGDANPALTATEAGTVNGDVLNYTLATDAAQFSSVGVSNITMTLGSNPNYSVLATNSTLTISAKAAAVTANSASKIYGQTVTFAGTEFTASGFVGGDAVTNVTLASAGAVNTAAVNNYPITASAVAGSGLGNYNINYVDGTLTVTAGTPLTINAPLILEDGNVQMTFTGGDAGVSYQIQASTNLSSTVWSSLVTNTAGISGLSGFTDLDATNHAIRFYRTVTP